MDDRNPDEKNQKKQKRIKLNKPGQSRVVISPMEKKVDPLHESLGLSRKLLLEKAKKPSKAVVKSKPNSRYPKIKKVIKERFVRPDIQKVYNDLAELVKNKVSFSPTASKIVIAQPHRFMKEDIDLAPLKQIISERSTLGYVTSGWNRTRRGHTRPMRPSHRESSTIKKAIQHAKSAAAHQATEKIAHAKGRQEITQAQQLHKRETAKLARVS